LHEATQLGNGCRPDLDPDTGQQQFARGEDSRRKNLLAASRIPPELEQPSTKAAVYTAVPLEQVVAFNIAAPLPRHDRSKALLLRVTR